MPTATATALNRRPTETGGWQTITCVHCQGYGLVNDYGGGDFNGAVDCPRCCMGTVAVSPKGYLFAYRTGPARGRLSPDACAKLGITR